MALVPGTRLGPYEVVAPIGAGGMGEVYRARDTRLERTVAIKTLPTALASQPELRGRFEREAKLISSLEHPHICALYDVGEHDATHFLVMQYLEGETLAERLRRGALPLDQALRYALEIADALHRAHQQGIVHRDLKPGNVMLTKSGAKLLDFGLAKLLPVTSVVASGVSAMPTKEQSITAQGTILGTFQYMAPEQLEGRDADARTDIFALGAVLYEMVTGRKAFEGASQASLISAIMSGDPPPIAERQPLAPPALERVIRTCLAKDPQERFDTAHDLLLHLKWLSEGGSQAGGAAPAVAGRRTRERIAWVTAIAAAVAAAVFAALYLTSPTRTPRPVRFIVPASGTGYSDALRALPSPNGRELAFVARGADRRRQIYVRGIDALDPRPIAGTTDAEPFLFWSPDSRFIGFFGNEKLNKVPMAGGPPQVISQIAGLVYGASWSSDGTILYGSPGGLRRVSAAGGPSEALTTIDAAKHEIGHCWPFFLPDGRRFLYLVVSRPPDTRADTHVLYVGSLDSTARTRLLAGVSRAEYAAPGHLVYVRDGTLLATPFDAGSGRITGDPMAIAQGIDYFRVDGGARFGTSPAGALTFATTAQTSHQLVWVDRKGKQIGAMGATGAFDQVRISPNGRQVAAAVIDPRTSTIDLWLYGVERATATRLTFNPGWENFPAWSHDGSRIAFGADHAGITDIYVISTDGSGREELLVQAEGLQIPSDWSRDGRFFMYWNGGDAWVLPLSGDRKPYALMTTPFEETSLRFSPDTQWIAYQSNETGGPQVYLRAFPGPGAKMQLSTRGGIAPRWRGDGRELYFRNERQLFAVSFDTATGRAGEPQLLFEMPNSPLAYEAAPDGSRFLMHVEAEGRPQPPITVLLDWAGALGR